ncbi:MAG: efflux RND transporter permease subunit, partial [Nitrospirota bacterium]
MARNHVAANLLMMFFIIGGIFMGFSIKQAVFPEIDLDIVMISVVYPGAGPEEIEEGIILKIEENISGINEIKKITSTASEGVGTVIAEITAGEDTDLVLQDIKNEVDRINTFPQEAEKPLITKLVARNEVINVVVSGDVPERSLTEQAETIRDELLDFKEITQAEIRGVRPYEISIEVPEENLRALGLTLEQIAQRVRQGSVDLPAGSVETSAGEILLRTKEKRYRSAGYEDITIVEKNDGTELKLGEIASVTDGFKETDIYSSLDGKPSAMVQVFRVADQKPLQISKVVRDYVDEKSQFLPESLNLSIWNDTSELYRSRLNLLLKNAFIGLILIFIVLGMFMQLRLAAWVMLGIPISFLGAMFVMPSLDVSVNMLSLFAFILALGIVVDDAIVVGENIFTHRGMSDSYTDASINGAKEVGRPVIFAVMTTVAAFSPLIFVQGMMGKFIKVIPFVVIPILLVSLIESLLILPAHLSLGQPGRAKS